MKFLKITLLSLSIGIVACQSSKKEEKQHEAALNKASEPSTIVDSNFLMVPGRSVGEISLGEDMAAVGKKLGRPDDGDAAMGKAWGIWYNKNSALKSEDEIAIYSSYRDTTMRVKDVKQIRITSPQYKTQDGLTTGVSESDTKLKFPAMERISAYLNQQKDTVTVYDAKKDGIGFEFLKGKSISITIHPMNQPISGTYLTLHPDWKLIE